MNRSFEDLASLQPDLHVSEHGRAQHLAHLDELARTETPTQQCKTRIRRRLVLPVAAVVGAAAIGTGTAAALGAFAPSAPVADRTTAYCFASSADLTTPANQIAFMVGVEEGSGRTPDAAAAARSICEGAWQQGRMHPDAEIKVTDPVPGVFDAPVPALTACVLDNGSVGIIPGDAQTCNQIGLPNAQLPRE